MLIRGQGTTQGLDDTSLNYNGANRYWHINGVEIHRFKAKYIEIVATSLCLGNISKYFSEDDMKNTEFYGNTYDFYYWLWCYCSWWYIKHLEVFNEKAQNKQSLNLL